MIGLSFALSFLLWFSYHKKMVAKLTRKKKTKKYRDKIPIHKLMLNRYEWKIFKG